MSLFFPVFVGSSILDKHTRKFTGVSELLQTPLSSNDNLVITDINRYMRIQQNQNPVESNKANLAL